MRPDLAQYAEFCWRVVAETGQTAADEAASEEIVLVCRPYLEAVGDASTADR